MLEPTPQKIPLLFYRSPGDSEPVRDWLLDLEQSERQAIGTTSPTGIAVAVEANASLNQRSVNP